MFFFPCWQSNMQAALLWFFFLYSSKSFEDNDTFIESALEEPNIGKQNKKCRNKSNKEQKTGRKPRWSHHWYHCKQWSVQEKNWYFKTWNVNKMQIFMKKFVKNLKKRCTSRGENLCFTVDQLRSNFKKCFWM